MFESSFGIFNLNGYLGKINILLDFEKYLIIIPYQ